VIAPVSEHWIHLDEPDLVIAEIRALVMAVNSETVPTTV
jgi:pimeloyl-ACP methyl ester carboxylesterase